MSGEMTKREYLEHQRQLQQYQNNPGFFELSDQNKNMIEDELIESYRVKFENAHWQKYQDLCDYDSIVVPVQGGKRQLVICQITPKGDLMECNKAYVFAHPGGGIMFDMEMFLLEGFRTAVLFKTTVFFVDYWKENIKAPSGSKDFAQVIEFINDNSNKFGIRKDHINVGGAGAGAWIILGALHDLVARKRINIVENAFFISPIVDETLSNLEPQHLAFWEEKWVNYNKGFFQMMAKDY